LFNDNGKLYLNFNHIPDLETFMQMSEQLKSKLNLAEGLNKPSEPVVDINNWLNNTALSRDGVYWAVSPEFYQDVAEAFSKPVSDMEAYISTHGLAMYASKTGFRVSDFASKKQRSTTPFVTQELINRLWMLDLTIRNRVISLPGPNTNVGRILLNVENKEWIKNAEIKQRITLKKLTNKQYYVKDVGGTSTNTEIPTYISNFVHNAEFKDYSLLKTLPKTDIEALLDDIFLVHNEPLHVKYGNASGTITLTRNVTHESSAASYSQASLYYIPKDIFTIDGYTVSLVEVGLATLPDTKKFSIEGLAVSDGVVAYKTDSEISDPGENAHGYGLEIDLNPEVLKYWSLRELDDNLTFGLYYAGGAHPTTNIISQPILSSIRGVDLDNTYIKTNLINDVPVGDFVAAARLLGFKVDEATTDALRNKLTISLENLISSLGYAYTLNDAPVYTLHLQVEHTLAKDTITGNVVRLIDKPLYFKIMYASGRNTIVTAPAPSIKAAAKWRQSPEGKLFLEDTITKGKGLSSYTKQNDGLPLTAEYIKTRYNKWYAIATGTMGWGALIGTIAAATAAAPIEIPAILLASGACLAGGWGLNAYFRAKQQHAERELIDNPYDEVMFEFRKEIKDRGNRGR